jgi:hypothetical protein
MAPHKEEQTDDHPSIFKIADHNKSSPGEGIQTSFPRPPTFENPLDEREYLKGRLAAAFRIFGKFEFDEGVAGHITIRE